MSYVEKRKGKKMSEEQKKKISITRTKNKKYEFCKICNKQKSKTIKELCQSCSGKIRATKFVNPMKGKKLSDEHKMKLLTSQKRDFTKPEQKVFEAYGYYGLKYTGDKSKWVRFKDGHSKNPDFIFGNYKIVIEVFGDYWHKGEDPNILIKKYEEIGYRCLVLWEHEINSESIDCLSETINQFINYDNYLPYCNMEDNDYGERFIVV